MCILLAINPEFQDGVQRSLKSVTIQIKNQPDRIIAPNALRYICRRNLMFFWLCIIDRIVSSYQLNAHLIYSITIHRVSQEECVRLRQSVPYVKLYRYNPKHLYPKLNGYGDNGQRCLKIWQLLHTYWLPNTHWNWQEYVVSVMLISVLNIKVTYEWHKAIKLNYKNTRTTVVFVLRFPSTLRRPLSCNALTKVFALRC